MREVQMQKHSLALPFTMPLPIMLHPFTMLQHHMLPQSTMPLLSIVPHQFIMRLLIKNLLVLTSLSME